MKKIIKLSGPVVFGFLCLWLLPTGCLSGSQPESVLDISDFCAAYKTCKCKDTFGKQNDACVKGVDAQTKTPPGKKGRGEYCRDLFERSSCYLAYPVVGNGAGFKFRNGARGRLIGPSAGYVRGACAQALACCVQIKTLSDRKKCISDFEGAGEDACRKTAGRYGMSLGSCNPAAPGGKNTKPPPPRPEPKQPEKPRVPEFTGIPEGLLPDAGNP